MARILTLDYLRGLAALSILIYHFFSFEGYNIDATTFLGRLGIYGVSIFYILSGMTLFYVYNIKMFDHKFKLNDFFIKRVARIHPLLIVVTLASIILNRQTVNSLDLILNLTGLFGFFKWDTYFATGAWSIGNELTFYTLFPILLLALHRNKIIFYSLLILIFAISLYFSFKILPPLPNNYWKDYVNPLNQVIYFVIGMLLGKVLLNKSVKQLTAVLVFIVALLIFIFYPTSTETIDILTGTNRYIFVLCSTFMVGAIALISPFKTSFLNTPLVFLGEISYSLYLIHPLVYKVVIIVNNKIGNKV